MTGQSEARKDVLLAVAFWSTFALAILSLVLSLFLLLLSTQGRFDAPVWVILQPYAVAALPWLYLDILTRAYHRSAPQRSRVWMVLVSGAGLITLVLMARAFQGLPHRGDPVDAIFIVPWLVGCLAFCAVIRIILDRRVSAP